jgi:tRNA dimethylallyltransferase
MVKGKTLIVIEGPTAVGKTALAINVARHFQTEIISADSRQFYREMSIGTAKPTQEELGAVKHHFINSHSINESFSVGDFEKDGLSILDSIFLKSNVAVMAGGSGLYIQAICEGFDELPSADTQTRDALNRQLDEEGIIYLQEKLKLADPIYYNTIDLNNPQRIIRALEVFESTGTPFSKYRIANFTPRPFRIIKIGLNLPRELLYERINLRVDEMIQQGLIEEARSLLPHRHLNALNTVGYKELFDYFDNKISLDQSISLIKQNTRRFAKRQLTWFRRDGEVTWFEPTDIASIINMLDKATLD